MKSVEAERVDDGNGEVAAALPKRTWKEALEREVRTHPFGYGVLGVALVAGPFLITMIFPEVTLIQSIVGGIAFGVYLALCAVPQKFM